MLKKIVRVNEPGPGHYDPKDSIDPVGNYYISKFKSTQTRSFPKSKRDFTRRASISLCKRAGVISTVTPGPGSYKLPSDFGHYESQTFDIRNQHKSFSNLYNSISASTNATSHRQNASPGRGLVVVEQKQPQVHRGLPRL